MPQCCNVTLTSPGLYSFSSFIENDFTPEYASKAYSSVNFHICRQLCGTVRTEPIIPLGFLVPPLGQYLYSEVRKILGPSTTDPSHLGLSSLQMREPGWPAPGPALPALSTYLQPFLSAVRLAWEAVSLCCARQEGRQPPSLGALCLSFLMQVCSTSSRLGSPSPLLKATVVMWLGCAGNMGAHGPSPTRPAAGVHGC